MIFKDMSMADVNLRLAGSWTLAETPNGCEIVLVTECIGQNLENNSGYYDSEVTSVYGYWGEDGTREQRHIISLEVDAPALGYLNTVNGVCHVYRIPERQTRAALPQHSCLVSRRPGAASRLDHMDYTEAYQVVKAVYLGTEYQSWSLDTDGALSPEVALFEGALYGPGWFRIGTLSGQVLTTQHPIVAQKLLAPVLGGVYASG